MPGPGEMEPGLPAVPGRLEQERLALQQRCKHAKPEQERELGVVAERRLSRGFKNLHEPSEEEAAIIFDGGRSRALAHMGGASAVGRMPWAGEATGVVDRLAQKFGMDIAWWDFYLRSTFGAQPLSSRLTSPSYGFGSATRADVAKTFQAGRVGGGGEALGQDLSHRSLSFEP